MRNAVLYFIISVFFFFFGGNDGYFYWSGWSRKRPRNGADGKKDSHTDKRTLTADPVKRPDLFGGGDRWYQNP